VSNWTDPSGMSAAEYGGAASGAQRALVIAGAVGSRVSCIFSTLASVIDGLNMAQGKRLFLTIKLICLSSLGCREGRRLRDHDRYCGLDSFVS
jgi:hypothetical protein